MITSERFSKSTSDIGPDRFAPTYQDPTYERRSERDEDLFTDVLSPAGGERLKPEPKQFNTLCERYLELILADRWNTLLLLLQAPIIAGLIVLIWRDIEEVTQSLLFMLSLSAIWFGTLNSCREIVKERAIFEREWMKGLDLSAYVWSKMAVLSLLGFTQCLFLVVIVNSRIDLADPPLLHLLVLFAASVAGTGLGLAISAAVTTVDRSLTMVPILLLPQILFSELLVSHEHSSNLVKTLDRLTITTWAFEGLETLEKTEREWGLFFWSVLTPIIMGLTFLALAYLLMKVRLPGVGRASSKKAS